jgi:hypothetical protein
MWHSDDPFAYRAQVHSAALFRTNHVTARGYQRAWAGVAVALLALTELTACAGSPMGTVQTPTPATTRTAPTAEAQERTATPAGSATSLPSAGPLAPGTYVIPKPNGSVADYQRLIVTLPAGWVARDGLIEKRRGKPGEMTLSSWAVTAVYDDPCKWRGSSTSDLDLDHSSVHEALHLAMPGATVPKRLRGGLANQAGRHASELTSVRLGGERALRVELSVPANLDLATCDKGEYRSWTGWSAAGAANAHHTPGQVDVVYLVDVDRAPLVIDASHMPGTSPSDRAELAAILTSMIVDRGP